MKRVNRLAVVVRRNAPYYAWAGSIDAGSAETVAILGQRGLSTVYLVDEREPVEVHGVLRSCWQDVFEAQLDQWHRDKARWPAGRSDAMFRKWFAAMVIEGTTCRSSSCTPIDRIRPRRPVEIVQGRSPVQAKAGRRS